MSTVSSFSTDLGARNIGIPLAIGRAVLNITFPCNAPNTFTFQYGKSVDTCGHGWHGAGFCGHSQRKWWHCGQQGSASCCGWAAVLPEFSDADWKYEAGITMESGVDSIASTCMTAAGARWPPGDSTAREVRGAR